MLKRILVSALAGIIVLAMTTLSFAKCCGSSCCDTGKCCDDKTPQPCCECCK